MSDGRDRERAIAGIVPLPGPRSQQAADEWRRLDDAARRALVLAATDPARARSVGSDAARIVVADLAAQRAARQPLDLAAPVVTGLLVLSTVWGFGRAVVPGNATGWLIAGVLGLVTTVWVGRHRVRVRRRDAAAVVRTLRQRADRRSGPTD